MPARSRRCSNGTGGDDSAIAVAGSGMRTAFRYLIIKLSPFAFYTYKYAYFEASHNQRFLLVVLLTHEEHHQKKSRDRENEAYLEENSAGGGI